MGVKKVKDYDLMTKDFNNVPIKERLAIVAYVKNGGNRRDALKQAGYAEGSLKTMPGRIFGKDYVKYWVSKKMNEVIINEKDQVYTNVFTTLNTVANANYAKDFIKWDGKTLKYRDFDEIPDHLMLCVKSMAPSRDGIKLTFYDRLEAVDKLMKHFGKYQKLFMDNMGIETELKTEDDVKTYLSEIAKKFSDGHLSSEQVKTCLSIAEKMSNENDIKEQLRKLEETMDTMSKDA